MRRELIQIECLQLVKTCLGKLTAIGLVPRRRGAGVPAYSSKFAPQIQGHMGTPELRAIPPRCVGGVVRDAPYLAEVLDLATVLAQMPPYSGRGSPRGVRLL